MATVLQKEASRRIAVLFTICPIVMVVSHGIAQRSYASSRKDKNVSQLPVDQLFVFCIHISSKVNCFNIARLTSYFVTYDILLEQTWPRVVEDHLYPSVKASVSFFLF